MNTEAINNTEATNNTPPPPAISNPTAVFGSGRYSNVAKELYSDAKRLLGLTDKQAERLAKAYIADLGRINAKVTQIGISKPNKDMQITLRETSKVKGVTLTHAITLAKLCVSLQEAKIYGIEKYDKVTLRADLVEWLDKE